MDHLHIRCWNNGCPRDPLGCWPVAQKFVLSLLWEKGRIAGKTIFALHALLGMIPFSFHFARRDDGR